MVATTDENKGVISVNKDDLTWVAFYSEFAGKLLPFANDRKTLIEKVKAVYTANNMSFSELEKDNAIVDIDPFTVFDLFNKEIKDADRIALLQGIAKAFSVNAPVPASFNGIPVLDDQKAAFSSFIGDRKDNDIQTLWEVFLSAMEYAETHSENSKTALIKAYDAALLQKGIEWNLTMALHWIRPYEYISLDSRSRRYISNSDNMPSDFISSLGDFSSVPSGEQYLQINDRCRGLLEKGECRCKNFPELSYCAWTASEEVNEGNHAVAAAKSPCSNVGEAIGEKNVDSRHYWLYQPGKNGSKWDEFYGAGIMAYHRGEIGDLTAYPCMDAMKKKMKECIVPNNAFNDHGPAAWNFANVMKPGDVVFVKKGMQKMVGRGIITSDYIFDPSRTDEFKNIRKMNWTNKGEWDHPGPKEATSKWLTDITPKKHYLELMNALFEDDAGEEIEEVEIQPQVQEMEIQPEVPEALTASEDVNEGDRAVAAAKSPRSNVGEAIGEKNVDSRRYWLYQPGTEGCKWDEFYKAGIMAIHRGEIGDLTAFPSKDAMKEKLKECIDPNNDFKNDGCATWEFANEMKPGDIVFVKKGTQKMVGRGIVTSDYMFDASRPDEFKHIRRMNWTNKGEWDHPGPGEAPKKTLTDETRLPHYIEQLNALFEDDAGEEIKEVEIQPRAQEVEIQPEVQELSYCALTASEDVNEGNRVVAAAKSQRSNVGEAIGDKNVDNRHYWMYSPGRQACDWDEYYDAGLMAIGWGQIGDLTAFPSKDAMKVKLKERIDPTLTYRNVAHATWQFANEMKPGDVVFVKRGRRRLIGRGVVTSDYIFDPSRGDESANVHRMNWTHKGDWEHPGLAALKTLTDITYDTDYVEQLNAMFEDDADEDIEEVEVHYPDYSAEDFLNEVYMKEADYRKLVNLLKHKKNIILQGAPGVGKTFAAKRLAYSMMGVKDSSRVMMVQFHQSYSYEDFIMGFRPASTGFELKKGPFYNFCKKAETDSDKDYFFIIDEINRGNLSKIFGELLMLIENDKRGVPLQLLYSNEKFSVPENVHIIGMMNTADRSLAMMDYALRRRFAFFEFSPAFGTEGFRSYLEGKKNTKFNNLIAAIIRLNEDIEKDETLGRGFCIGHSYFCTENAIDDMWLKAVVNYEILPLLNEYWFDEPDKVEDWESKLHQAIQ